MYGLKSAMSDRLHGPPKRDHLASSDVGIEGHRLVSGRADLEVMPAGRQRQRRKGRREVRHGTHCTDR